MLCTWFHWTPRGLTLAEVKTRRDLDTSKNVSQASRRQCRIGHTYLGELFGWLAEECSTYAGDVKQHNRGLLAWAYFSC